MTFKWKDVPGNPPIGAVAKSAGKRGLDVVHCGTVLMVRDTDDPEQWTQFMFLGRRLVFRRMSMVPSARHLETHCVVVDPVFECSRCEGKFPEALKAALVGGTHPLCQTCLSTPGLLGAIQRAGYEVLLMDN